MSDKSKLYQLDGRVPVIQAIPATGACIMILGGIFPQIVQTIFAENCVAVVFILAVLLNLLLPQKKEG